jgi:hypothetical protein
VAGTLALAYSLAVPPLVRSTGRQATHAGDTNSASASCDNLFDLSCCVRMAESAPELQVHLQTALPLGLGELVHLLPARAGATSSGPLQVHLDRIARIDLGFALPAFTQTEKRLCAMHRHNT